MEIVETLDSFAASEGSDYYFLVCVKDGIEVSPICFISSATVLLYRLRSRAHICRNPANSSARARAYVCVCVCVLRKSYL